MSRPSEGKTGVGEPGGQVQPVPEIQFTIRKGVAFAFVICVGFFAAVEIAARVTAFVVYDGSPYFLMYGFRSAMATEINGHSVAREGYAKYPPNKVLHQYGLFTEPTPIRINSAGMRGVDFEPLKPQGVLRVVSLGGSSTFGFYDRDDFTYPAILQGLMRDSPAFQDVRPEVINAGIPHARAANIIAMLEGEILDYSPDIVTVYTGFNDAVFALGANIAQRTSNWLHGHFASYVALKRVISLVGGPNLHSRWTRHVAGATPQHVQRQVDLHVEDFTADLARISELCRLNGIELVLIKQPVNLLFRDTTTTGMTYEEKAIQIGRRLEAGERIAREETGHFVHSRMMEVVNQVAQAAHVHVMDFIPIVDQHPEFFASYVHITEAGNEALANELLQAIIRVRGAEYTESSLGSPSER